MERLRTIKHSNTQKLSKEQIISQLKKEFVDETFYEKFKVKDNLRDKIEIEIIDRIIEELKNNKRKEQFGLDKLKESSDNYQKIVENVIAKIFHKHVMPKMEISKITEGLKNRLIGKLKTEFSKFINDKTQEIRSKKKKDIEDIHRYFWRKIAKNIVKKFRDRQKNEVAKIDEGEENFQKKYYSIYKEEKSKLKKYIERNIKKKIEEKRGNKDVIIKCICAEVKAALALSTKPSSANDSIILEENLTNDEIDSIVSSVKESLGKQERKIKKQAKKSVKKSAKKSVKKSAKNINPQQVNNEINYITDLNINNSVKQFVSNELQKQISILEKKEYKKEKNKAKEYIFTKVEELLNNNEISEESIKNNSLIGEEPINNADVNYKPIIEDFWNEFKKETFIKSEETEKEIEKEIEKETDKYIEKEINNNIDNLEKEKQYKIKDKIRNEVLGFLYPKIDIKDNKKTIILHCINTVVNECLELYPNNFNGIECKTNILYSITDILFFINDNIAKFDKSEKTCIDFNGNEIDLGEKIKENCKSHKAFQTIIGEYLDESILKDLESTDNNIFNENTNSDKKNNVKFYLEERRGGFLSDNVELLKYLQSGDINKISNFINKDILARQNRENEEKAKKQQIKQFELNERILSQNVKKHRKRSNSIFKNKSQKNAIVPINPTIDNIKKERRTRRRAFSLTSPTSPIKHKINRAIIVESKTDAKKQINVNLLERLNDEKNDVKTKKGKPNSELSLLEAFKKSVGQRNSDILSHYASSPNNFGVAEIQNSNFVDKDNQFTKDGYEKITLANLDKSHTASDAMSNIVKTSYSNADKSLKATTFLNLNEQKTVLSIIKSRKDDIERENKGTRVCSKRLSVPKDSEKNYKSDIKLNNLPEGHSLKMFIGYSDIKGKKTAIYVIVNNEIEDGSTVNYASKDNFYIREKFDKSQLMQDFEIELKDGNKFKIVDGKFVLINEVSAGSDSIINNFDIKKGQKGADHMVSKNGRDKNIGADHIVLKNGQNEKPLYSDFIKHRNNIGRKRSSSVTLLRRRRFGELVNTSGVVNSNL